MISPRLISPVCLFSAHLKLILRDFYCSDSFRLKPLSHGHSHSGEMCFVESGGLNLVGHGPVVVPALERLFFYDLSVQELRAVACAGHQTDAVSTAGMEASRFKHV